MLPAIDIASVQSLLDRLSLGPVTDLTLSKSDLIEQVYSFTAGGRECTVAFRGPNMCHDYWNEENLRARLLAAGVPLRAVAGHGELKGLHYTIVEEPEGVGLDKLTPEQYSAALPSVLDTLLRISSVDLSGTDGYGPFGREWHGWAKSWPDYLSQVGKEDPGDFYGRWHAMFDTTFLDRVAFETFYAKMVELFPRVPATRQLVHSGFGYGNVRVKDGQVTAVLDWTDPRFGDGLYDAASYDFWRVGDNFLGEYQRFCAGRGIRHEDFDERIRCYKYYQGLDAMRYFAKAGNRKAYEQAVQILQGLELEPDT